MALFLEITSGNQQGSRTRIRDGLTIGRRDCVLTIRDSKLSGKHAKVEERPDGGIWLVDLKSQNGIKAAGSGKVPQLRLEPGVEFTLGRTVFKVISAEEAQVEETPTSALAVTVTRTFWDNIRELAARASRNSQVQQREVAAFSPLIKLKFVRGVQAGTEWILGYGPRMIGTASLDLHLEDPTLPAICFRLLPDEQGVRFKNESEKDVKLNGKWVKSELLRNGDLIDIVNTQIQVVLDGLK